MDRYERLYVTVMGLLMCCCGWSLITMGENAMVVCVGLACLAIAHFILGYLNGGR